MSPLPPYLDEVRGTIYVDKLIFFVCGSCGAMCFLNFRDDWCSVCNVAMKVKQVTVREWGFGLEVKIEDAPHEDTAPAPAFPPTWWDRVPKVSIGWVIAVALASFFVLLWLEWKRNL